MPSNNGFAIRNLSVLSFADGFTLWHYRGHTLTMGATLVGPITLDDVLRDDFFSVAGDLIVTGDMILVSAADGGMMLYVVGSSGVGPGEVTIKVAVMTQTGSAGSPAAKEIRP
jgi:hypothetical protein